MKRTAVSLLLYVACVNSPVAPLRSPLPVGSTGPLEAYEVTTGGSVVWHIVVEGNLRTMYRATPLGEF